MLNEKIKGRFVTNRHMFDCAITSHGQRLQEILNSHLTTYLQILNVSVFRFSDYTTPVATFRSATVLKSTINMAMIPTELNEAPEKRMFSYVSKNYYRAFITVAGFDIQGTMHFMSAPDATAFLVRDVNSYFPVTDAQLNDGYQETEAMRASVILVRKSAVSFLHLGELE